MIQKAWVYGSSGIRTFMEKTLTINVGSMMAMVMIVRALIRRLRLLLMIEARASIRPDNTCE